MFFTYTARIIAILAFVVGLFRVSLGFGIAFGFIGPYEEALKQFTTASTSGEVIDSGLYVVLFAVALGMLAEISFAARKTADK